MNSILESKSDNHAEIKPFVLSGLRKLAIFCRENEKEAYQQLMTKYSANYLKTLLNLYREEGDHQAAAMSTAREMVKLTPAAKLSAYYQEHGSERFFISVYKAEAKFQEVLNDKGSFFRLLLISSTV